MNLEDFVKWFGHASFLLKDENGRKLLFLDPFELKDVKDKADLVLITHAHFDHWSPVDLRKVLKESTNVVAVNGCSRLSLSATLPPERFHMTEPFKEFSMEGIKVKTIPAYNINPVRLKAHPRENNWVGYVVNINGKQIYHAGDTDFIPEMKQLKNIDVAMLPIGGTFTMDVNEAIEAANLIRAKVTLPIHYKRLLGDTYKEAEHRFKSGVKGEVALLEEFS